MSTQPFSSLETTTPKPFTTTEEHREQTQPSTGKSASTPALENHELRGPRVCATRFSSASVLDGPWKVTILPEPPPLPPGVLPAPDPHAMKSQPWRRGDVTRLKDDSPKGMMEYIATHTRGWWQELAERALRDNEKAERLVREAGWQPGQCWALEVDAEAKQKLLEAEEAKRQREQAERAKEVAEKEAFMQRQMELLKKAGKAPRCEYLYTDGQGCRAPQVKGERWCHGHAKAMSYRPEQLEMELMEDEQAVMVNLYRVTRSLLAGRISEKTAGLMLWSIAIGMPGAKRSPRSRVIAGIARDRESKANTHHGGTETRRKGQDLPRIHAHDRGSEKQLTNSKTNTFETQRKRVSRGEQKVSRELGKSRGIARNRNVTARNHKKSSPLINTENTDQRTGHAGVTKRKSFKSGVSRGSRGLPEMPRVPKIGESENPQTSVSPCLRGEPLSSIRVNPRESAVGSFPSSASPRLCGENDLSSCRGEIQEIQGEAGL